TSQEEDIPEKETSCDAEEISQVIRKLEKQEKTEKTIAELVPPQFHKYLNVFEKKASERMPVWKPWDHAIDLKPDFVPKKAKVYPLSPEEHVEVREFVEDQLRKGYCYGFRPQLGTKVRSFVLGRRLQAKSASTS
ncbi:hypothetical protein H0H81_011536, partial [Sphagnurus paluster]